MEGKRNAAVLNTYPPVSYTHLDVYKRQKMYLSNKNMRNVWEVTRK